MTKNKEVWVNVGTLAGYEDYSHYEVSNLGRVKSTKRVITKLNGRSKKPSKTIIKSRVLSPETLKKIKYVMVNLLPDTKGNKQKHAYVHRLVALAFVDNPDNEREVNHIDEDKDNNTADNLEWCSHSYNMHYGYQKERANNLRDYNNGKATNLIVNKTMYIYKLRKGEKLLQQARRVDWTAETTADYFSELTGKEA